MVRYNKLEISGQMIEIYGFCYIKSELAIKDLALLISEQACGGIEFNQIETYANADIPEMRTGKTFLGLGATLFGDPDNYGFEISLTDIEDHSNGNPIDLSEYFCTILNRIEGVLASTEKSIN